jgi:hypothetical protein
MIRLAAVKRTKATKIVVNNSVLAEVSRDSVMTSYRWSIPG